jgi:hypothetical protein
MADVFDTIFAAPPKKDEFDDIFESDEFDDIFSEPISIDEPVLDLSNEPVQQFELPLPTAGADPSSVGPLPVVPDDRVGLKEALKQEFGTEKVFTKIPIVGGIVGLGQNAATIEASKRLLTPNFDYDKFNRISKETHAIGMTFAPFFPTTGESDKKKVANAIKNFEFEQRGKTFAGKVASGVSQLPTWMIEFAATGGLASLGDDVAQKAGQKLLGKYVNTAAGKVALKTAGLTAGAVVRTSIGLLPRVGEKATARQALISIGVAGEEGWATSLAKAWGDVAIESFSEETGGLITKGLSKGLSKLPFGGKFITSLQDDWVKLTGGTADNFATKMLQRGGYSSIIGEVGEERVGTLLREATGVSDREGTFGERIWEAMQEDFEPSNLGSEIVTLLVPAGARAAATAFSPQKTGGFPPPAEVDTTLAALQSESEARAKIAENVPLDPAEREQFPELARQEDQIAKIRARDLRTIQEATPESIAEQAKPPPVQKPPAGPPAVAPVAPVAERLAEGAVEGVKPTEAQEGAEGVAEGKFDNLDPKQEITVSLETGRESMTVEDAVFRIDELTDESTAELEAGERAEADDELQSIIKELDKLLPVEETAAQPPAKPKTVAAKATEAPRIIVPEQIQKGKPFKPVSKKGPGLTQAEQAVLTPAQQEQFRFTQTQGEKAGFKAGMQEAVAENRKKIKNFQLAEKLSTENRTEALEVVKQFVPKEKQAIFTRRILNAKTPKRVDRITQAVQLFIDKAEKRAAVRDFKAFLNKTNKEFRRGEVKLGKLPTDIREKVIAIVDKFDPAKITERKRKQLEKRDEFIKRVSGTVADAFESLEDAGVDILQIPNARIDELQRLSKVHIGTLSTEQVNYINASLDHLIQTARKRGESKERARSERVAKQVNAARQEVSKRAKDEGIIKQPTGVGGMFRTVFVQGQSSIRTMAGRATIKDNKATMDLLVESIQDAKRAEHVIIKEFSEAAGKAISKDLGFTNKDSAKFDKLISITLGGKRFKIDVDNLFSIYMHIRADGNLRQLLNSEGLNITVVERDPKLLNVIKTKKQILTGRVQLSEVREVVKIIEAIPKFKELSETTFKLNKDVVSSAVNKTSIAFQNFPIARKDRYWPQPRSLTKNIEGKATDVSVAIEQQGMFLPKKGGTARLLIRPYRSQFVNILQTSAQFSASTLPMRDAKSLLGNKQWQDNMRKAGRGAELKGLIMMFRRMQGLSTDKAFVDLAGAKLLNNFGKSVLSLRLSGYGVQTASIPAAYEFIDPKYFKTTEIIRKAARIPAKDIQEMIDLSPTLWIRWKAKQFNYVTGGVAAQHSFNNMILSKTPLLDKFLNQYTWGDQKAIKIIFDAAQNKVAAEQGLKKGTAENKKAGMAETERAVETQPNWDIIYRSPLTSSPNVFLRGSLMFQSARNAQMNVLMRAIDDFNKGRTGATEAGKRMGGVLYANTLVAIVKRLLKLGIKAAIIGLVLVVRDEEEDAVGVIAREGLKEVKRLPQDTVINLIGLPAFGNIPANIAREVIRSFKRPASSFRKITDVRTGNFFTDLILDATGIGISAGSLGKHLLTQEKISKGPREGRPKWKDDAKDMAAGIAELIAIRYGLPLAAPKQEIFFQTKAALRATEPATQEEKRRTFFSK